MEDADAPARAAKRARVDGDAEASAAPGSSGSAATANPGSSSSSSSSGAAAAAAGADPGTARIDVNALAEDAVLGGGGERDKPAEVAVQLAATGDESAESRDARRDEVERLLASYQGDGFELVTSAVPMGGPDGDGADGMDGEAGGAGGGGAGGGAGAGMPAFRYSSTSVARGLRVTPEMEEALRATGVNVSNYAKILNPTGYIPGRRKNAFEIDLDDIDHPKWREPGAITSDFFNFGLSEGPWREYAARQVALRLFRQQHLRRVQEQHTHEFDSGAARGESPRGYRSGGGFADRDRDRDYDSFGGGGN